MEQSINYLKEILQSLNLEKSEDDDPENEVCFIILICLIQV